jgi:hypothetical protein
MMEEATAAANKINAGHQGAIRSPQLPSSSIYVELNIHSNPEETKENSSGF